MASTIGTIAQLLDATLDPNQHRKGMLSPSLRLGFGGAPPSGTIYVALTLTTPS